MKLEFSDYDQDVIVMPLNEVAEQLVNCGAINLEEDERIGECRLEFGCDLEIDIDRVIEDDPRCKGYNRYTETFTIEDIRAEFSACDYYKWCKDEEGNDVLACFG